MASEKASPIRLAVFGRPVRRSLSPRIHSLFASQAGLQVDYRAIEATPETFPDLVSELAASGGRGCNVTVPLKQDAWRLADRASDSALRAHAANTLVFYRAGELYADNTDGQGLVADLQSTGGVRLAGTRICLLGAGGAAAGVLGALLRAEPVSLVIANRTRERAGQLAESHADLGRVDVCSPDNVDANGPFDLVINATSLGHEGGAPDIDPGWLEPGGLVYDMNYGQAAQPLLRQCEVRGIRYADGLGMLVRQAALSFRLWTGISPDPSPVLKQLRSES